MILITVCCTSCRDVNEQPAKQKNYSFYHWNTVVKSTAAIQERIKFADSDTLYLRFFDLEVDKQKDAVLPIATVQFDEPFTLDVNHIVPVIYIKNEVFIHRDGAIGASAVLASNVASKLKRLIAANLNAQNVLEVQVDCDWTDSTQEAYFAFLKALKSNADFATIAKTVPTQLTATIRLHQVKYRERTGVPPVDRGVVMAYNVGDLGNVNETNSIINNETTKSYLARLQEYPLPFDVALPVFSWHVVYRDHKLQAIVNEIDAAVLEQHTVAMKGTNKVTVTSIFNVGTTYLYKDDVIRQERVSAVDLEALSSLIKQNAQRDYNTIFYHINAPLLQELSTYELYQAVK